MLREQPLNAGEEAYGRLCTEQSRAPDSREKVLVLSLQFCSLCQEGHLDLISLVPEQKIPAGHIHTKCLAGVQNMSSVSHVYLSYANSTRRAARHLLLSWSLLHSPLSLHPRGAASGPRGPPPALFLPGAVMSDPPSFRSFRFFTEEHPPRKQIPPSLISSLSLRKSNHAIMPTESRPIT